MLDTCREVNGFVLDHSDIDYAAGVVTLYYINPTPPSSTKKATALTWGMCDDLLCEAQRERTLVVWDLAWDWRGVRRAREVIELPRRYGNERRFAFKIERHPSV